MATYDDLYSSDPLTGKDVGLVFGVIHENVKLSVSPADGDDKTFTFDPDLYGPFYPRETYPYNFTATKTDITIYDDGVELTPTIFDEKTGTVTVGSAPAKDSVISGDCVEQRELYIAQNAKLTPKQEDEKLDQLRNSVQRKTYGNIEFSLKADFKISDLETLKMIFEETGTAGRFEFPETPPIIYCAIIVEADNVVTDIIYCEDARATFSDILSAKAGKNAVENGFEITFGVPPRWVNVEEATPP